MLFQPTIHIAHKRDGLEQDFDSVTRPFDHARQRHDLHRSLYIGYRHCRETRSPSYELSTRVAYSYETDHTAVHELPFSPVRVLWTSL